MRAGESREVFGGCERLARSQEGDLAFMTILTCCLPERGKPGTCTPPTGAVRFAAGTYDMIIVDGPLAHPAANVAMSRFADLTLMVVRGCAERLARSQEGDLAFMTILTCCLPERGLRLARRARCSLAADMIIGGGHWPIRPQTSPYVVEVRRPHVDGGAARFGQLRRRGEAIENLKSSAWMWMAWCSTASSLRRSATAITRTLVDRRQTRTQASPRPVRPIPFVQGMGASKKELLRSCVIWIGAERGK